MSLAIFLLIVCNVFIFVGVQGTFMVQLEAAPQRFEQFLEIATQYNELLPSLWNELKPEERIFAYYIYRASIPGNRIITEQTHRQARELIELFEHLYTHKELIQAQSSQFLPPLDISLFLREIEIFLVYLYAHHGQYFLKEFAHHKRTPARLGLKTLTPETLQKALEIVGDAQVHLTIQRLHDSLFVTDHESTVTVEGDIGKSAGNMYSIDFTQEDFDDLNPYERTALNAYCAVKIVDGKRVPCVIRAKIDGHYSQELQVSHYWLHKAYEHVAQYSQTFDSFIVQSLAHLLQFLITGSEEDFRQFSIAWLKTNSRLDFNFGFIEVYQDPMQYKGTFAAEVTVKTLDMEKLNAILPAIEDQLPFPAAFKRLNLLQGAAVPNASVNAKIFAAGDAGPVKITAAYCLPNYEDIRAEHGSKQIIYQMGKGIGELVNAQLARKLFNISAHVQWLEQYDPHGQLDHDIWDAHVILHETLGHGSGRFAEHVFVPGDPLAIGGKTYQIGESIAVTPENANEFFGGFGSAFEELRAEILALYTSIFNFDELAVAGIFKSWPVTIGKQKFIERMIIHMAEHGLTRLLFQADNAQEIVGAHARANTAITNYLIDHGGLRLVRELYAVQNKQHTVVGIAIDDIEQVKAAIKTLAIEVQRMKSTADGQGVARLMQQYGTCVRYPELITALKENQQVVQGQLKEVAEIFPRLIPVYNEQGSMIDIAATWPASFLEQQLELSKLALSCE